MVRDESSVSTEARDEVGWGFLAFRRAGRGAVRDDDRRAHAVLIDEVWAVDAGEPAEGIGPSRRSEADEAGQTGDER